MSPLARCARGLLAGAVLLVAGCGGESAPSTQPPTSAPAPSPQTSSPPPPPSPEEAAAVAALVAFQDAVRVTDQARKDPAAQDWEPAIRRHLGDPAAVLAVQSVRDYATLGLRQEGDSVVTAEVTEVDLAAAEGPTVRITGCFDSGSRQVIDVNTGVPVAPGTPPRFVWNVGVTQFPTEVGEPWLVTVLEPLTSQPC
ncbi:hypothetical protein SAMN05660657_03331 [Geodermatophilus amargosae]|uniref:Lipoprotein n=1 Tax=Geodermatophilus amargosae TaxID=1296565 RepID=A0A1I7B6E0_9ACTN|nr:hypothetical protein SAMN05660657_03331 [Geodermatophilus amargosae]